jgi:OOP family OmpA-OmpF porin
MKKVVLVVLLFGFQLTKAQKVANYYFDGNLDEFNEGFISLDTLNGSGYFAKEVVDKFGKTPRNVYVFPRNTGLLFNNPKLESFITGPFAIEMYFRYDNGELLLYNQLLGDKLERNQGKYVHLVLTRDDATKRVIVYFQGKKELEFFDKNEQLDMDINSQISFFVKDGVVTTSGAVAMIKVYDYFIEEEVGDPMFASFNELQENEAIVLNIGEKKTLNQLYFIQSQAKLLPESNPELESLVKYLQENKKAKIELQGHTDNQGDYYLNIKLSKERAETIKEALVASGISASRIKTRGLGGSSPIANNNDETRRKLNRRVEMVLL